MRVAITADWHVGRDLKYDERAVNEFVDRCLDNEVDLILHAGDVFDRPNCATRDASTGAVQRIVVDAFLDLVGGMREPKTLIIPGNHDCAGVGSADALHCLNGIRNVTVVRARQVVGFGAFDVFCVPWDWGASPDWWRSIPTPGATPQVLLAHCQVVGARFNSSKTCEGGSFSVSREALEAMPFHRFALGDFHARQALFGKRGGYVGALRQLTFGEEGNPAGFELWDSEADEAEWVELRNAPKHRTMVLKPNDTWISECPPNTRLKVRCEGWEPERDRAAALEASGDVQIEVLQVAPERVARVEEIEEGVLDKPAELLRLWAAHQRPEIEGGELDELLVHLGELTADESEVVS